MYFLKRSVALILVMGLCCLCFFANGMNARAEDMTAQAVLISFPREGDVNYDKDWGHPAQTYLNGWSTGETDVTTVHAMGSYTGTVVYCIEPSRPRETGDRYIRRGEDFWDNLANDYNATLTPVEIKKLIGRILTYGYQGQVSMDWRSQNEEDSKKIAKIMATQILVWETIVGERDANFNKVDVGSKDSVFGYVKKTHPLYATFLSYYNSISANVKKYTVLPSFLGDSSPIILKWDGTYFTATLTDKNKVADQYTYTCTNSNVTFSKTAGALIVKSTKIISNPLTITASKSCERRAVLIWTDDTYSPKTGLQDAVTYGATVADPITGKMQVKTSAGFLQIGKQSEDGKVAGVSFTVSGEGIKETVVTDENGDAKTLTLNAGTYTITETMPADYYVPRAPMTIKLEEKHTMAAVFKNTLKRGAVIVTKQSEDGNVENVTFRLSGTAACGQEVKLTATTDENGIARFENVLISGDTPYTLEEVDTPSCYAPVEPMDVIVAYNEETNISVENTLKRYSFTVKKIDKETKAPLEGAIFALFRQNTTDFSVENALDTKETDEEGKAIFENLLPGLLTLKELKAPDGYQENTEEMEIFVEQEGENAIEIENEKIPKVKPEPEKPKPPKKEEEENKPDPITPKTEPQKETNSVPTTPDTGDRGAVPTAIFALLPLGLTFWLRKQREVM